MATAKTYQCLYNKLSCLFGVDGKSKRITFDGEVAGIKRGIYTTADEKEQDAIEASARFKAGDIYLYADYATETTEGEEVEGTDDTIGNKGIKVYPPDIVTVQAASRILIADYAVSANSVSTKEKLLTKAAELKVSFPGLA